MADTFSDYNHTDTRHQNLEVENLPAGWYKWLQALTLLLLLLVSHMCSCLLVMNFRQSLTKENEKMKSKKIT